MVHYNPALGESQRDRFKRLESERIMRQMKEASEEFKSSLKEQFSANAEVQRMNLESQEERTRRAIEKMIANRKEYNDFKAGRDTTQSQAEKDVRELIHKLHRDRGWE